MSALHRVDDTGRMPARRFFILAERLPAYQGAVRAALLAIQEETASGPAVSTDPRTMAGLRMQDGSPVVTYTQVEAVDPAPTPPARLLGA